jgi:Ger(x)C family germination protein
MSMGGKVQSLLLGKRLLRHKGWFELLDPLYRDNKNTVLALVVLVDGPVSELMNLNPQDKPRLPTYVTELVSTANRRNITVATTLQELHRQMYDKGMTPSITQLEVEQEHLNLMGTALLREDGRYALTLNPSENKLFSLLYPHRSGSFPFTFTNPSQSGKGFIKHNLLSFTATGISTKTRSSAVNGRFRFDVQVKLKISLSELLFPIDIEKQGKELEKQIEREFEKQYDSLFAKMQKAKVDPIGFGFYARASQYRQWKEVQDHWEEAFSDAEMNINVKVKIMAMGATK